MVMIFGLGRVENRALSLLYALLSFLCAFVPKIFLPFLLTLSLSELALFLNRQSLSLSLSLSPYIFYERPASPSNEDRILCHFMVSLSVLCLYLYVFPLRLSLL